MALAKLAYVTLGSVCRMKYQVDQSGKIEDTSTDTILAVANEGFAYTLKIPTKVKRELQTYFRDAGEPKLFIYKTFAVGLFSLLNAYNMKIESVEIDKEYPGHEELIGNMLKTLFKVFGVGSRISYSFGLVGKSSPAHDAAYKVTAKKEKEDKRLGVAEIKQIASCLSAGLPHHV